MEKNHFMLDIATYFLKFNFLERRIDGAKMIKEVCKNCNIMTFSSSSDTLPNISIRNVQMQHVKEIIAKIKDQRVIYQIFSKDRGHLQLVQRSEDLLKLLIS